MQQSPDMEEWEIELDKISMRYHVVICWVAVVFNLLFSIVDYLNNPDLWFPFFMIRLVISLLTSALLLVRTRLKLIPEIIAFVPFVLISLQNAIMWSNMTAPEIQKHTFSYIALFIGGGMMCLWKRHWSIKVVVVSFLFNFICFPIFSDVSLADILANGGFLTGSVAIFSIFLMETRYRLNKQAIVSRLALEKSNMRLAYQKKVIEEKNAEITDSIKYAEQIQSAILPPKGSFSKNLKNPLIFYKPKDIVAGDFYWLQETEEFTFFAAADCTGHGVPGAMMSMVCTASLNRAVSELNYTETNLILDLVRKMVINTFTNEEKSINDGMDIALCRYNHKTMELQFSGAKSPLYRFRIIQNGEELGPKDVTNGTHVLEEYKGDRQPVGKYRDYKPFESTTIQLNKGDYIFIFSDGYADQFGGEELKKFKYGPFKKLLLDVKGKNLQEQEEYLGQHFKSWKGDMEQIDDVCIIGVEF